MGDDESEKQRKHKYRDHDIAMSDISNLDFTKIKSAAINDFVHTLESDQCKLIVQSFMGYLTTQNFRIVKKGE